MMVRHLFPGVCIRISLDGGFAQPADFLDAEPGVEYVLAVASNAVLQRKAEEVMQYARVIAGVTGETEHVYSEANYAAGMTIAMRTTTSPTYFGADGTENMKEGEVQLMPLPSSTVHFPAGHPIASSAATFAHGRSRSTDSFVRWAEYIFKDLKLTVPARDHLESIVQLALRAQELFFGAALHHPGKAQLDHYFREFITLAAVPTPPPAKRFS